MGWSRLDVPSDLAYGETPPGDVIQPGDALSYVIEVRVVVPLVTADDAPLDLQIEPSVGALEVTTEDLEVGDGATVELGKTAVVHMLLVRGDNEVVLFNSWERNDPLQIIMQDGATLPGILEGLQGATVGTLRVITVPPDDGFGACRRTEPRTARGDRPDRDRRRDRRLLTHLPGAAVHAAGNPRTIARTASTLRTSPATSS